MMIPKLKYGANGYTFVIDWVAGPDFRDRLGLFVHRDDDPDWFEGCTRRTIAELEQIVAGYADGNDVVHVPGKYDEEAIRGWDKVKHFWEEA